MEQHIWQAQKWVECAVEKGWLSPKQAQKLLQSFVADPSGPKVWELALKQQLMSVQMVEQIHKEFLQSASTMAAEEIKHTAVRGAKTRLWDGKY